jgi:hypothetical protein
MGGVNSQLVFAKTNPISVALANHCGACPNPRHQTVKTSKGYKWRWVCWRGVAIELSTLVCEHLASILRYLWEESPNGAIRTLENVCGIKIYCCLT